MPRGARANVLPPGLDGRSVHRPRSRATRPRSNRPGSGRIRKRPRQAAARVQATAQPAAAGGRESWTRSGEAAGSPLFELFQRSAAVREHLHTRAVARVFGVRLTGFLAWWLRRTYYLFQMPRWDRRRRIVLDWTVALFFRPDITRVDLRVERELVKQARHLVERPAEIVHANDWSMR